MSPRAADPAKTHALLVGVEKYDAGEAWNLDGPAGDVLAYHDWLRSRGVPAAQITTLLSTLDTNAGLARGIESKPATSEGVRAALNVLRDKRGDLLILVWSGHGVVNDKLHRLFVADATVADKRNFSLDKLRESLASKYFAGFPSQIVLVDACANIQDFAFSVPSEEIPCGDPLPRDQFVFLAARRGQVAKNRGAESRGQFSIELLRLLQSPEVAQGPWPPDMRGLAEKVQKLFAELRASKESTQTPIYELQRDWDGNVVESGPPPASARPSSTNGASWKLTVPQIRTLTEALLECTKLQLPGGRDDLLGLMRFEIRGAANRRSDAKSDMTNILKAAGAYPGGLQELLQIVRDFEGPSFSWSGVETVLAESLPTFRLDAGTEERK